MHTYYESGEYECEDRPGTFGSVKITGDDDGPCFVFATDDGAVLFELPIPACEAMAIRYGLDRAIKRAMRANERDEPESTHAHAETHAGPLEPGMTPYGRREIEGPGPQDTRPLPRAADRFPAYSRVPATWTVPAA